jgi:hypothetical protein
MIGRSEVIWDNHEPDFVKSFEVDYLFEESQKFYLEVYDMDDENSPNDLKKQDYIGSLEFVLGNVVSARDQKAMMKMNLNPQSKKKGSKVPTVIITAEEKKVGGGSTMVMKLEGTQFN